MQDLLWHRRTWSVCTAGRAYATSQSNLLGWIVYQIFLPKVLRCARVSPARELRYQRQHQAARSFQHGRVVWTTLAGWCVCPFKHYLPLLCWSQLRIFSHCSRSTVSSVKWNVWSCLFPCIGSRTKDGRLPSKRVIAVKSEGYPLALHNWS